LTRQPRSFNQGGHSRWPQFTVGFCYRLTPDRWGGRTLMGEEAKATGGDCAKLSAMSTL